MAANLLHILQECVPIRQKPSSNERLRIWLCQTVRTTKDNFLCALCCKQLQKLSENNDHQTDEVMKSLILELMNKYADVVKTTSAAPAKKNKNSEAMRVMFAIQFCFGPIRSKCKPTDFLNWISDDRIEWFSNINTNNAAISTAAMVQCYIVLSDVMRPENEIIFPDCYDKLIFALISALALQTKLTDEFWVSQVHVSGKYRQFFFFFFCRSYSRSVLCW